MSCETQNVAITFNDDAGVGVIFDDAQGVSLTFNDDVNVPIACDKFGEVEFAPESVLFEYFEADDLALSDGASVDSWAGRNGNATLTQPGASNLKPTYRASAGGASLPGVEHDGVDDYLIADALAALLSKTDGADSHPEGSIIVVLSGAAVNADYIYSGGASGSNNQLWGLENQDDTNTLIRNDGTGVHLNAGSGGTLRATDEIIIERVDASDNTRDLWFGDTQEVTDGAVVTSTAQTNLNQFTTGALRRVTVGNFAAIVIHAIGIVGTPLTDADVANLQTYATTKWGY